ncbi:UTP---glucose-1-phosphate uridylyltransferase [Marchantia polymorpha subsp. ruderalis]
MATHNALQSVLHTASMRELSLASLGPYPAAVPSSRSSWNGGAWLVSSSSKHFLDRNELTILLQRGRRNQKLNRDFSQRCSISCEGGNDEDRWGSHGHGWDVQSPGQRRSSYVPLALSTLPITQPSPDAEKTEKWRLDDEITELQGLQKQLISCKNLREKISAIETSRRVKNAFNGIGRSGIYVKPAIALAGKVLDERSLYVLKCLVAIGQDHLLDYSVALEDAFFVQDESNHRTISSTEGKPVSSVKEVLKRLAKAIENWDGSGNQFWQSMPNLITNWSHEMLDFSDTEETIALESLEDPSDGGEDRVLQSLTDLTKVLERLEKFYDSIGGIVGYQLKVLELIKASELGEEPSSDGPDFSNGRFSVPRGPDLASDQAFAMQAASWGLEGLSKMGEIYPLGGAGDRLGLVDEVTGECLPVAMLPYCGRTLLEGLIRDLQAREFLHFKVFGRQHITPVAIMTSAAKKNNERVLALCKSHGWFGRGKENFRLFEQPLVPTVAAADGQWLVTGPFQAVLKPGGHGVIWKLAYDEGILQWFQSKDRKAAIVRQISNPIAATDCTLLALSGMGLRYEKKFGFASCDRNVGTAEGVNVLMERRLPDGRWEYGVTCIEYTEFNKLGILDVPIAPGSTQAQYPANTNVLFVDLPSVEHIASSQSAASLPGMILNLKKPVKYVDHLGHKHSVLAGRLECTMQNIADSLVNKRSSRLPSKDHDKLDTYVIYNQRRKVTSSAKRRRKPGEHSLHQTPDGSFLDVTRNAFDLLSHCGVHMPEMEDNHRYVDSGPPFIVLIHPSIGPLWDIVSQKIQGGSLTPRSELQLEISEFAWTDVQLDGSLLVRATNVMGAVESNESGEGILQYGVRCGKCRLNNVNVTNKGVDWECKNNIYWQNKISRLESLEIILEDNAEFEANNVTIEGSQKFFVPKGHRMIVTNSLSGMSCTLEKLSESLSPQGSWSWRYDLQANGEVLLEMITSDDSSYVANEVSKV